MLTVELQESELKNGDFVWSAFASISLHDDGRVEVWDPSGFAKDLMMDPVPSKGEDGQVRRLYFQDNPEEWLRHLGFILHSGVIVPLIVRDDEMELTRSEVAERVGVTASTWGGYVSRGQAPEPVRRVGSTPLWRVRDVDAWQMSRRGRGKKRVAV